MSKKKNSHVVRGKTSGRARRSASHGHLSIRKNGVIYTTAKDLLSDPRVRRDMDKTTDVMKKVGKRKQRERNSR